MVGVAALVVSTMISIYQLRRVKKRGRSKTKAKKPARRFAFVVTVLNWAFRMSLTKKAGASDAPKKRAI
ncbi:MAG: hypothetical protein GY796_36850 [Chloroflexi bacterium]|nr:hypothetical protein [Chloroflexota bacterium]